MILDDKYQKTVRIPVTIKGGNVQYFYGGPLPELEGVVIGDLVVPAHSVKDEKLRQKLNEEVRKPFLAKGSTILVNVIPLLNAEDVRPSEVDRNHLQAVKARYFPEPPPGQFQGFPLGAEPEHALSPSSPCGFSRGELAEVTLLEDLQLLLRGTKPPSLVPCKCRIPHLDIEVKSLNQAYSRLSEVFEPHRLSHTGNVFRLCYYQDGNLRWRRFDTRRLGVEFEYAATSFCGSHSELPPAQA